MEALDQHAANQPPSSDIHVLPERIGKWQAVRLVRALHRELGLSERACRALEIIAMPTREEDWHDPRRTPICYRRKGAMADELGVSGRQFYNLERQLENAGLLERRLTRNGWRGTSGAGVDATISGLSLMPLVQRASELAALSARRKTHQEHVAALRLEVRIAWGQLARRLAGDTTRLALAAKDLAPPRCESFAAWSPDELRRRLIDLQQALAAVSTEFRDTERTSDAPEAHFRSHTRATHKEEVTCSGAPYRPSPGAPKQAPVSKTSFRADDLRRSDSPRLAASRRMPLAITVDLLRRIATPELRFYLEGLSCGTVADAERAILFRLRELGIGASAYEGAREVMGVSAALVAVTVIDRNRSHPVTPVRNPGGLLRAMTRRHRAGALDLAASVLGILAREPLCS